MKLIYIILIGVSLGLFTLGIVADINESGDTNAIGMYFLVFGFYVSIIGVINGLYLKFVERSVSNLAILIGAILLPIGILIALTFTQHLQVSFIAKICTVAVGITNLIWIINKQRSQ